MIGYSVLHSRFDYWLRPKSHLLMRFSFCPTCWFAMFSCLMFCLSRRGGACLLALLVCTLYVPNFVEAGCGDYVLVGGQAPKGHAANEPPTVSDLVTVKTPFRAERFGFTERERLRQHSIPVPAPCRGPSCSERSVPPAAPAPQINLSIERWAYSVSVTICRLISSSPLLAESFVFRTDDCGSSILRPPRPVA
ncbi:MAG: hypothetical protein JWM11_7689 [Planctomycetaceae bacterium]|nr:hypothetical protein [Planctomycetaceae bacterium]